MLSIGSVRIRLRRARLTGIGLTKQVAQPVLLTYTYIKQLRVRKFLHRYLLKPPEIDMLKLLIELRVFCAICALLQMLRDLVYLEMSNII